MTAYVIVTVTVTNPEQYDKYKPMAAEAVAKYGGRYLARGGQCEVLEGALAYPRNVILEFESVEAARRWYNSPEYQAAKSVRAGAADGNFIVVEGV